MRVLARSQPSAQAGVCNYCLRCLVTWGRGREHSRRLIQLCFWASRASKRYLLYADVISPSARCHVEWTRSKTHPSKVKSCQPLGPPKARSQPELAKTVSLDCLPTLSTRTKMYQNVCRSSPLSEISSQHPKSSPQYAIKLSLERVVVPLDGWQICRDENEIERELRKWVDWVMSGRMTHSLGSGQERKQTSAEGTLNGIFSLGAKQLTECSWHAHLLPWPLVRP